MKANLFPRLVFAMFLFVVIFISIASVSYFVNEKTIKEWLTKPQAPGKAYQLKSGKLYATVKGQGDSLVVVLSGLGTSSAEWWAIQDNLAKDFQTLTYDRPGYTWSETAKAYDYNAQTQLLYELLQELKVQNFQNVILVGHNLGANIANKFSNLYPVRATVLIDPLISPSDFQAQIDAEWRDRFIDQTKNLERFVRASQIGFFRFLNITPYDVPESIRPIVLNNIANAASAKAVLNEYMAMVVPPQNVLCCLSEEAACDQTQVDMVKIVIHHNSEQNIDLMKSFGADHDTAVTIENELQANSKKYGCSKHSSFLIAKKSVFDIHIQEPELIINTLQNFKRSQK